MSARHVIEALELPAPRALLILNGATAELDQKVSQHLDELFTAVARVVIDEQITVLTGATNAGIFALFGRALEKAGKLSAPCLGVTAGGCVRESVELEQHHSHFALVETDEWEKATPLMYKLAAALAKDCQSLAVFAGGGLVTRTEMLKNVKQNREMILIAGSQGSTDAVVTAYLGEPTTEEDILRILHHGRLTLFGIEPPPEALANLISSRLLSV